MVSITFTSCGMSKEPWFTNCGVSLTFSMVGRHPDEETTTGNYLNRRRKLTLELQTIAHPPCHWLLIQRWSAHLHSEEYRPTSKLVSSCFSYKRLLTLCLLATAAVIYIITFEKGFWWVTEPPGWGMSPIDWADSMKIWRLMTWIKSAFQVTYFERNRFPHIDICILSMLAFLDSVISLNLVQEWSLPA